MGVALVNGRNFAHKDIVFNIGGVPIVSLSNLSASDKQMKEFSYGTGDLPVGFGIGRKEPVDVTFEISMTDFIALQRASSTGDIKDLDPFNIPVTLINVSNPASVKIHNVMITETPLNSDIDSLDIKVSITAIASHVTWK